MIVRRDLVIGAAKELREALAANATAPGKEWTTRVEQALTKVERALKQHAKEGALVDESPSDPESALLPSPGVERRELELRDDLDDLIVKVQALRTELSADSAVTAGNQRSTFVDKASDLVRALERQEADEIDMVQESITPDIGAGD
jgi:hydroxypyruvate isomerase